MNLRHTIGPDCPIMLRYGLEEDRDFLSGIITDVWATIPEQDKAAILSRGFNRGIVIDVVPQKEIPGLNGASEFWGGDICLSRRHVDLSSRQDVVLTVAHELAHKLDNAVQSARLDLLEQPAKSEAFIALCGAPKRNAERRVDTILKRWGYLKRRSKTYGDSFTAADRERIGRNWERRKTDRPDDL